MTNTLIAFFSRRGENYVSGTIQNLPRGNAELIAEFAQHASIGDLFEIAPMTPYPTDYHRCTETALAEKNAGARPTLTDTVEDISTYETIILVYPNWWDTMPMPVYTFLESYDFAGKKIMPCCTHEGSGLSNTVQDITRTCPQAIVTQGLAIAGSSAAHSKELVENWIAKESR